MEIIHVITFRLWLIFPEIPGKFPKILNFRKFYNPNSSTAFNCALQTQETDSSYDEWPTSVVKLCGLTCSVKCCQIHQNGAVARDGRLCVGHRILEVSTSASQAHTDVALWKQNFHTGSQQRWCRTFSPFSLSASGEVQLIQYKPEHFCIVKRRCR